MNITTERIVEHFPQPYSTSAPSYDSAFFDSSVRDYCEQNASQFNKTDPKCAKCIIVGEPSVGKTCLINRFAHDTFESEHKATIGVDFAVIKFKILETLFQLQIWDTAGQDRFQSIAMNYYKNATAAIIVFDMSRIATLSSCRSWAEKVTGANRDGQLKVFIVGTKADALSPPAREFVEKEAIEIAQQLSVEFWAVSSQTGENVDNLFNRVTCLCFEDIISATIKRKEEEKRTKSVQYHENFVRLPQYPAILSKKSFKSKCKGKLLCCSCWPKIIFKKWF